MVKRVTWARPEGDYRDLMEKIERTRREQRVWDVKHEIGNKNIAMMFFTFCCVMITIVSFMEFTSYPIFSFWFLKIQSCTFLIWKYSIYKSEIRKLEDELVIKTLKV